MALKAVPRSLTRLINPSRISQALTNATAPYHHRDFDIVRIGINIMGYSAIYGNTDRQGCVGTEMSSDAGDQYYRK